MKYKQLDEKKKVQIDTLLDNGLSMRETGKRLNVSHSTISRYKNQVYQKRVIQIHTRYPELIDYLISHYDRKDKSIEVCLYEFKRYHPRMARVTFQQVYNWINEGKITIKPEAMCTKRSKRKKGVNGMMNHLKWNVDNKTVLPLRLRPKSVERRDEIGHLEIDSILGKRNEQASMISVVDRCTRRVWLIKAEYKHEHYINNLIHSYLVKNEIVVKSITVDNGLEFKALGIAAKRLGVKLYKCDPYCSFQRGSNERMNGIVRRYIPKGHSLSLLKQQYFNDIAFRVNSMPRKSFDFHSAFDLELLHTYRGAVQI